MRGQASPPPPREGGATRAYIRTTPERLWAALAESELTQRSWFGFHEESDWTRARRGSSCAPTAG
jgi:uncharacterized protein YndB with AHSA1/START domain